MELIKRTQLRAFVTEGLSRIGENPVGLDNERDLERAAVRVVTQQLLDLAEMLETLASKPTAFAFDEISEDVDLPSKLYCEITHGSVYRRCTDTSFPEVTHQEHFVEFKSSTGETSTWRKVFTDEPELTIASIRKLSKKKAVAKAKILRRTVEELNVFKESFESLEALSESVTQVFRELKTVTASDTPQTMPEPALFQATSITAIPTAIAMVSSILAQLRKDLWQQDQNGYGYYQHRAKGNPENYVEHYIGSPGDIEILPWEQAEQIIDKFGFTTVKLHLLLAAHTMNQAEPWRSNFVIKGSSILKELGWDRRTDIPLHEKLNEIAKAAFVLDCLLVRTVWVEGRTKSGRVDASIPIGRMWTVVIEPHGQLDVNGQISEPEEVYLGIQPGLIFERFLNKAGSKLRQALYQFGYLAQEVLKIDPYHDELALRLAIHLTMDSRIHPSGRYQVATLLETILPTTIVNTARQDSRRAFDLKKRWDSALTLLTQLNWEVDFDESYPESARPGSKQRSPKGYFEQLLAANIVIKPRSPIPQLIAKRAPTNNTSAKPTLPRLKPSATLTGEQIRQARQEKQWNQRQLAGWMGVSQTLINHWEREKRFPSPEQESRLRSLLELQSLKIPTKR